MREAAVSAAALAARCRNLRRGILIILPFPAMWQLHSALSPNSSMIVATLRQETAARTAGVSACLEVIGPTLHGRRGARSARACASTGRARKPISTISEMPARRGHPNAAVKFTGLRHVPLAAHHSNLHDLLRLRKGTRGGLWPYSD